LRAPIGATFFAESRANHNVIAIARRARETRATPKTGAEAENMSDELYDPDGLAMRRKVLGDAYVERALDNVTPLDADFQQLVTKFAWGAVWARPGLDPRTRSLLTIAVLAALGREEELRIHIRATANTGATREEVCEALLQVAIYAGVPAANTAFRVAKSVFDEKA
jgi:4-carboxymuconolactone decarboxylase